MLTFRPERLRELREAHGLTLDQMAEKLGKRKQQLSIWENGVNMPSLDNFVDICNSLDVDLDFFFDETPDVE